MIPDARGYKVAYVYPDGPADKEWVDAQGGRLHHRDRRHADRARRQLLAAAQRAAERVRHRHGGRRHRGRGGARGAAALHRVHRQPQVRGLGRPESRRRRQGDERPDRLRPHPLDGPAVARAVPERDRSVLEQEGHHRRHPLQRRRQHGPAADRHPRAEAVPVLEQPVRRADVGPPAAAGDRRAEGHDDQLAVGLGQRGDADGVQAAGTRPPGRQSDVRGRHRDRFVRAHQRRVDPHARLARRHLRPRASRTTTASTSRTSAWRQTCGWRTRPRTR